MSDKHISEIIAGAIPKKIGGNPTIQKPSFDERLVNFHLNSKRLKDESLLDIQKQIARLEKSMNVREAILPEALNFLSHTLQEQCGDLSIDEIEYALSLSVSGKIEVDYLHLFNPTVFKQIIAKLKEILHTNLKIYNQWQEQIQETHLLPEARDYWDGEKCWSVILHDWQVIKDENYKHYDLRISIIPPHYWTRGYDYAEKNGLIKVSREQARKMFEAQKEIYVNEIKNKYSKSQETINTEIAMLSDNYIKIQVCKKIIMEHLGMKPPAKEIQPTITPKEFIDDATKLSKQLDDNEKLSIDLIRNAIKNNIVESLDNTIFEDVYKDLKIEMNKAEMAEFKENVRQQMITEIKLKYPDLEEFKKQIETVFKDETLLKQRCRKELVINYLTNKK